MQQLLEYIFFVLDNNSEAIDELDSQVLEGIINKIRDLSTEELSCLIKLFDVYENYYCELNRAADEFRVAIKEIDRESNNNMGLVDSFNLEISCMSEHNNRYRRKLDMFGKLADIAENVLGDRKRQLRN